MQSGSRSTPNVIPDEKAEKPRADLKKPWAAAVAAAGLQGVRIHDLHHSFASIGTGGGLGLPVIGRLLGHGVAGNDREILASCRRSHAPGCRSNRHYFSGNEPQAERRGRANQQASWNRRLRARICMPNSAISALSISRQGCRCCQTS